MQASVMHRMAIIVVMRQRVAMPDVAYDIDVLCASISNSHFGEMTRLSKEAIPSSSSSDTNGVDGLRSLIRRLARAFEVLDHNDVVTVERICESAKEFLQRRANDLVRRACGLPVLRCYSSDATPGTSEERVRMVSSADPSAVADRRGKSTKDFLMQLIWFKTTTPAGDVLRTPVFRDGQPLSDGKSAWNMFSAMKALGPSIAELGHSGIALEFFCADRGMYECMDALCRKQASLAQPLLTEETPEIFSLKQWYCSAACSLHDGQNALKWALYLYMSDASLMKEVHVIIASLRNTFEELAAHIGSWLREVLVCDQVDFGEQGWYAFWVALGALPQYIECIMRLRLTWAGGKLHVCSSLADSQSVVEDVSMVVLAMMQFESFSDSRWLGAGPACRCLLRSMMLGLESLVRHVRQDKKVSGYYISGFDKLNERSRQFVGVASVVSFIPEAFQVEILEDPRIPMRVDELEALLQEEARWAMTLPDFFFSALSDVLGAPVGAIRHEVIASSVVCLGFLTRRVLRAARQMPWRLCAGSVEDNLESLAKAGCPEEDTSRKIWQLIHMNFPKEQLVAALRLLQSCPWSIAVNEQMHGQQAAIQKAHRRYSRRVLTARSMVSLLRPLVMPSTEERKSNQLKRKMESLDKRKPDRLTGLNLFVREAMESAAVASGGKERLPTSVRLAIVRESGAQYNALDSCQKGAYSMRASIEAAEKKKQLEVAKEALRSESLLRQLRSQSDPGIFDLLFSHCTFTDAELRSFGMLMGSVEFSRARLVALRDVAMRPPPVPPAALRMHVSSQAVQGPRPLQSEKPSWLAPLCIHREAFRDAALIFEVPSGDRFYFAFAFAVQRPYMVCLAPLVLRQEPFVATPVDNSNFEQLAMDFIRFDFEVRLADFVLDAHLPFGDNYTIFLVPRLKYLLGGRVVSTCEEVPLQGFIDSLQSQDQVLAKDPHVGAKKKKADTNDEAPPNEKVSAALKSFPWLLSAEGVQAELFGAADNQGNPDELNQLSGEAGAPGEEPEEVCIDEVFEQLRQRRTEVLGEAPCGVPFPVKLLGGAWTARNRGVPFDAYKSEAATRDIASFCMCYSLPRSARYDISLYGESGASLMAHAWSKKMSELYRLYYDAGGGDYKFDIENLDIHFGDAFEAYASGLEGRAATRARQLCDFKPVNPPA